MSSRLIDITGALETRLAALAGPLATEFENVVYNPTNGVPYQRVNHLLSVENPTMGSGIFRQNGIMQVTLLYPLNEGAGNALVKAQGIRDWFQRGSSYTQNGVTVRVSATPDIAAGFRHGDRWVVPVSIPYFADVS